ncbi:MAG TPA: hypothetical protein VHL34_24860, partial [Rhizomicrobium sp.]|nr:hypothetical protein [Rhizomicrobium sp.]
MADTSRISQQTIRVGVSPVVAARIAQQTIRLAYVNVPPPPEPVTPSTTTFRIRRERVTPTIFSDGKRVFHRRLQLDCQPGIGNATDPGATPAMLVFTSDDGGVSWTQQPR